MLFHIVHFDRHVGEQAQAYTDLPVFQSRLALCAGALKGLCNLDELGALDRL